MPRPFSRALPLARNLLADYLETQMRRDIARWLGGYVEQLGRAPTGLRDWLRANGGALKAEIERAI